MEDDIEKSPTQEYLERIVDLLKECADPAVS